MPTEMVVPERERPGITASAWPQPTIKASATVAFLAVLWPRAMRSEKNRINPVASRAQETMMELENSWFTASCKNTITNRGTVAMMMSITIRRAGGGATPVSFRPARAAMPRKNSRIISTMSRQ